MQDSFLRYMGVYLLVSNHTKHFRSVYGKLLVFQAYIQWVVLLCHTPSTCDFIGTLIKENSWHVDILQCNMLLWFKQTDNFTSLNHACLLAMNLCRVMKLLLVHIP